MLCIKPVNPNKVSDMGYIECDSVTSKHQQQLKLLLKIQFKIFVLVHLMQMVSNDLVTANELGVKYTLYINVIKQ